MNFRGFSKINAQPPVSQISVPMLFGDVLAGDFSPATDPEKRNHTLYRLALGAIMKGTNVAYDKIFVPQTQPHGEWMAYTYSPSWAYDVAATSLVDQTDIEKRLMGLRLCTGRTVLSIIQGIEPNYGQIPLRPLLSVEGLVSFQEPIELGPKLQVQQDRIASLATEFFRTAV